MAAGEVRVDFNRVHMNLHKGMDISNVNLSLLSESEKEHILLHKKHQGHEGMHATMLLILILFIVLAQIILIAWKKKHQKSYQNVSMFGMWLIPLFISVYNHWFRFISIWLFVTIITIAFILKPLLNKKINGSIPRLIYRWFFYLYSISSLVAVTGYFIIMSTLLGLNVILGIKPQIPLDIGFLLLFYGIYYGVLTRDFTDFLVDLLAANIGYYSPSSSLPSKQLRESICAICGRSNEGVVYVDDGLDNYVSGYDNEKIFTLSCGHKYHEFCIYGWALIGKKQVCPFCREKVDTRKLFASLPFQRPHYLYGNLLDFIRYLVAWQPLIIFAVQAVNYLLGLE
ncbi:RING finger protein 121-like protein [Leptotrombidium deliense]|uniref:RING finger protein 121-like protein n=1 Tax=Leptotrombidium deliense TaxID=299467 RepID=A0A443SSU2_9ACAR|nr:RING finger protein 121-like protein [Leptotrombidium deliense]